MNNQLEPAREALRDKLPGFEEIHPPLTDDEALLEADRCLECGGPAAEAPCTVACPADVDVPFFIRQIRDGHSVSASLTIFESNVLGGSCARVCPVDELCQGACVMRKEGRRPVEIGRLQRYATDRGLEAQVGLPYTAPVLKTGNTVAVIGAGPAGLACAAELARLGHVVKIFEKRDLPGGLVTYGIAPYKQRIDPIREETDQLAQLGVRIEYRAEVGVNPTYKELRSEFDAIFVGVGMGADTSADLPGEDLQGVWESLPFIEAIKLGNAKSLGLGKEVAVIGGGNTAIDVVREAIRLGARKVTLVYRRDEASMPAFRHEVEAARAEGAEFVFLASPKRLLGEGRVTGVECVRMELGEPDSSGRRRPVPVEGSEFVVKADTVITAIGQQQHESLFAGLGLKIDRGRLVVDDKFQTSDPKMFAGGDSVNGGDTVVEAIRHGKVAARGIHCELTGDAFDLRPTDAKTLVKQDGPFTKHYQDDYYLGTSVALCKGCNLCINSCPAEILSLDSKNKIQVSDVGKCVFCGMCEARCPDFAIWIVKDGRKHHPIEVEAKRRLTR